MITKRFTGTLAISAFTLLLGGCATSQTTSSTSSSASSSSSQTSSNSPSRASSSASSQANIADAPMVTKATTLPQLAANHYQTQTQIDAVKADVLQLQAADTGDNY